MTTRPEDLFTVDAAFDERAADLDDPVLVVHLAGFVDAGTAGRLAVRHMLADLEHVELARFDADLLVDYRSRRPPMVFQGDHWESYETPELLLHHMRDRDGQAFLLLAGVEPDLLWDRFVAAVGLLVERIGVRTTYLMTSIPMAVPHTRPVGVTAHATRPETVASYERWVGTVGVPGHASGLLELRLGEAGRDAVGFAVHVPHYLSQAEYPEAAAVLLENVASASGLVLPTDMLRTASVRTRAEVDEQVRGSEDVAAVVQALEAQYDAVVGSRGRSGLLSGDGAPLPTADELGAELERFLAEQDREG